MRNFSFKMAMAMAREYITTRAAEQHSREASVIITRIKDFFEKKLWHQLTEVGLLSVSF